MKLIKTILGFLFNQLKLITPLFLQSSNLKKVFNYYQVPGLFETSANPRANWLGNKEQRLKKDDAQLPQRHEKTNG